MPLPSYPRALPNLPYALLFPLALHSTPSLAADPQDQYPTTAPAQPETIPTEVIPLEEEELPTHPTSSWFTHLTLSLAPLFAYTVRESSQDLTRDLGFDNPPSPWGEGWEFQVGFRLSPRWFLFFHYLTSARFREETLTSPPGIKRFTEEVQTLDLGGTWMVPVLPKLHLFLEPSLGLGTLRYTYAHEPFSSPARDYGEYVADLKNQTSSSRFSQSLIGTGFSYGLKGGVTVRIRTSLHLFFALALRGGYYPGSGFQEEASGLTLRNAPTRIPVQSEGTIGLKLFQPEW